jgi:hypothetical protein
MIEVHIDLKAVDVILMTGFPDDAAPAETLYDEMTTIMWGYEGDRPPPHPRRYLAAIGLYLADRFESSSWRVTAFNGFEVARMEYILPEEVAPRPVPVHRVSRYERDPVI